MEIEVGHTMELSDALITKIDNLAAEIRVESEGRSVLLRMDERGATCRHHDRSPYFDLRSGSNRVDAGAAGCLGKPGLVTNGTQ